MLRGGKKSTTDELSVELARDILGETREVLFKHATERYLKQLQNVGIKDKPDLSLKRRNGEKANASLANDVVELYVFATELEDEFPKAVIANVGKFIEFKRPTNKQNQGELDNVNLQRRMAEMACKSNEMTEKIKAMCQVIDSMKDNYEARIKSFEKEMGQIQTGMDAIMGGACTTLSAEGSHAEQLHMNKVVSQHAPVASQVSQHTEQFKPTSTTLTSPVTVVQSKEKPKPSDTIDPMSELREVNGQRQLEQASAKSDTNDSTDVISAFEVETELAKEAANSSATRRARETTHEGAPESPRLSATAPTGCILQ